MRATVGVVLACVAAVLASGCLRVNARLDPAGGGRAWFVLPVALVGTEEVARQTVEAPGIEVQRTKQRGGWVAVRVGFEKVEQLADMRMAKGRASVALAADGDKQLLTLVLQNPPRTLAPQSSIDISVLLPRVPEPAPGATIEGSRVVWQVPASEYVEGARVERRVRF